MARAASTGDSPRASPAAQSWTTASVSVSVSKVAPAASSSARSARWFSMMPLCTTATPAAACGWAFLTDGAPCVAQRVWPMPAWPRIGSCTKRSESATSLPTARRRARWPSCSVAMPALS